jgi:predicted metal-dependent peptidase
MAKKTAAEMLTSARAALVLDAPFFASLLLRLRVEAVDEKHCPTMGTDGLSLVYNAKFVETLTQDTLKGVLCHEAMHVAMLHHLRRGMRDPLRWNLAADYSINPLVKAAHYQLPKEHLYKEEYLNKSSEEIYPLIKVQEITGKGGQGGGSGDGSNQDPTGCGAVYDQKNDDGSALNDGQKRQAEQEAKMAIAQAAQAARMQGKLPAELDRLVGNLLQPRIPWREILARFITEHVKSNYNWKMPNKRYVPGGIYLPQIDDCEIGTVALFCDTSGSIQEDELNQFVGEIQGILRAFPGIKLIKMDCDSAMHGEPEEIEAGWVASKFKGGGGTSFVPPFKYCEKHSIDPICSIYLTDGECNDFPKNAPEWSHLWVLIQEPHWGGGWKPPFGETIRMDEREANGKKKR